MKYSFDDLWFGITKDNNRTLAVRLIARPASMRRGEWYAFAGDLARIFNGRHAPCA